MVFDGCRRSPQLLIEQKRPAGLAESQYQRVFQEQMLESHGSHTSPLTYSRAGPVSIIMANNTCPNANVLGGFPSACPLNLTRCRLSTILK